MSHQLGLRKGAAIAAFAVFLAGCGGDADTDSAPSVPASTTAASSGLDRVVKIDGERGLYLRCTGSGSPTLVMEGGDGDTSDSYAFAKPSLAKVTRTCVYDRANLERVSTRHAPKMRATDCSNTSSFCGRSSVATVGALLRASAVAFTCVALELPVDLIDDRRNLPSRQPKDGSDLFGPCAVEVEAQDRLLASDSARSEWISWA